MEDSRNATLSRQGSGSEQTEYTANGMYKLLMANVTEHSVTLESVRKAFELAGVRKMSVAQFAAHLTVRISDKS